LARVGAVIQDQSVSRISDSLLSSHLFGGLKNLPQQLGVVVVGAGHVYDGLSRNDQDVHRGLGIDVSEGDAVVVLVDEVGGNLSRDDLLEEGHEDS
jgi:hypothetical protein